jgi:hypothetical protein
MPQGAQIRMHPRPRGDHECEKIQQASPLFRDAHAAAMAANGAVATELSGREPEPAGV